MALLQHYLNKYNHRNTVQKRWGVLNTKFQHWNNLEMLCSCLGDEQSPDHWNTLQSLSIPLSLIQSVNMSFLAQTRVTFVG